MQVEFWSFLVLISTMRSSQCIVLSQRLMRKGANKHYAHLRYASTVSGFQGFDSNFNTGRQPSHEDLHKLSRENPDLFWGTLAKARLRWMQEFNKVQECQMKDGKFSWFLNGKLNIAGKSVFLVLTLQLHQWNDKLTVYHHWLQLLHLLCSCAVG